MMSSLWRRNIRELAQGTPPDVASVSRHETNRRARLGHLSADRIEDRAGAVRARLPARQLNPDIGQPEALGDASLRRYIAIRSHAAVVHPHAAIHQDDIEIGLNIVQLKNCLAVL